MLQEKTMDTEAGKPVALVTGALRGIGRACACELARAGFNLVLNDLESEENARSARGFAEEIAASGARSISVLGDVADLKNHALMLGAALRKWGRLDCLVNNAGISARERGDLLDVTPDSFDRCIAVNTRAVFFLCQTAARHMIAVAQPGVIHRSIINITSSNARAASITRGEYCVSKAASSMTTKLFALRLAAYGIGVYEVRPGIIDTEMTKPAKEHYEELIRDHGVPAERMGQPADVASTVVCMAEGRLRYTVGQAVTVDGGFILPRF